LPTEWANILSLMKLQKGVIRGTVRWETPTNKGYGYCHIEEFSGALLSEFKESVSVLMSDIRGCKVDLPSSSMTAIRLRNSKDPSYYIVIDPGSPEEFCKWLAVFLSWASLRAAGINNKLLRFRYPELDFSTNACLTTSSNTPFNVPTPKPVRTIKVGRLEIWDPSMRKGYTYNVPSAKWITSSCLLKTNGEFQLYPEEPYFPAGATVVSNNSPTNLWASPNGSDQQKPSQSTSYGLGSSGSSNGSANNQQSSKFTNNYYIVLPLSLIRRSAIQKADPSLTGRDNCIVIYLKTPKDQLLKSRTIESTTSSPSRSSFSSSRPINIQNKPASAPTPTLPESTLGTYPEYVNNVIVTPIYLYFEDRTTFEVWFVLFRSLALPELYGPDTGDVNGSFRQHRVLNVRIVDAQMQYPKAIAQTYDISSKHLDSYVDIELNDKLRGRTRVKYGTNKPFWREDFEFQDLPFLLNNVKFVVRARCRRSAELNQDPAIGEVRILFSDLQKMQELKIERDLERWFPLYINSDGYMGKTGEICVKVHISEFTILASREYNRLLELLLNFSNRLTVRIAKMTNNIACLAEVMLDIFQATGQATEWIIALADDEIKPIQDTSMSPSYSPTPPQKIYQEVSNDSKDLGPYSSTSTLALSSTTNQVLSEESNEPGCSADNRKVSDALADSSSSDRAYSRNGRDHNVTDSSNFQSSGSSAIASANLLFRGNSLLTKALDFHMKRIGRDYLEHTIGSIVRNIVKENSYCEVDPTKIENKDMLDANWKQLEKYLNELWGSIKASTKYCPPSLRRIFHSIRVQIENRFGEFVMSASYSGISGFLFLRFFCPAVLNPKLFGLVKDHPNAQVARTLTLLAKGLQGLANRTYFGSKEPWMAPLNSFLHANTEDFQEYILNISTWRSQVFIHDKDVLKTDDNLDDNEAEANERALSMIPYKIPNAVISRLPEAFVDNVPSLPFLIDRSGRLAELVDCWLAWYDSKVASRQEKLASLNNPGHHFQGVDDAELSDLGLSQSASSGESTESSIFHNNELDALPDQYTDELAEESSDAKRASMLREMKRDEDMVSGLKLSGDLLEFHKECLRIRNEVQKLRYESSIPEIPSEVPSQSWDYYVNNFLDTSAFNFTQRGAILKTLLQVDAESMVAASSTDKLDVSDADELSEDSSFRASYDQPVQDYSMAKSASPDVERPSSGGIVTESVSSGTSAESNLSRGSNSIGRKSKSLRLPYWRKWFTSSPSSKR
ncbi:hypothetical protein V1511DRAFT_463489, partial [Dipodascopsis uninucleata]